MFPNWSPPPPQWKSNSSALLLETQPNESLEVKLNDFKAKSENFPIKFPVDTGRCKTLENFVSAEVLERNINSTYPLVHENVLELFAEFILLKRSHASKIEKKFYEKMTLIEFINRLLKNRAVAFFGRFDTYLLINGKKASNKWNTIGTETEKAPLILNDCLSYDEIKLAAFLAVSSYTYFVNVGDRKNNAIYTDNRDEIEDEGIIIGLIGTRLKKYGVMEYQELVVEQQQNTEANGYGKKINSENIHNMFSKFYGEDCMSFDEVANYRQTLPRNNKRYTDLKNGAIFDNLLYYKRMCFTIDTMLLEANERAKFKKTYAYLHVVGLGLGVWKISPHQEKVFMDICAQRIRLIGSHLHNTSDICFSYINEPNCGGYKNGELFPIIDHPLKGIKIHIFKRNPHSRLTNSNKGKLLVVSYAWDGNALPGNEYWLGKLGSSGDSAAASSTQITELHNPHINDKVSADNLHVVTQKHGIITFKEYQEQFTL